MALKVQQIAPRHPRPENNEEGPHLFEPTSQPNISPGTFASNTSHILRPDNADDESLIFKLASPLIPGPPERPVDNITQHGRQHSGRDGRHVYSE